MALLLKWGLESSLQHKMDANLHKTVVKESSIPYLIKCELVTQHNDLEMFKIDGQNQFMALKAKMTINKTKDYFKRFAIITATSLVSIFSL